MIDFVQSVVGELEPSKTHAHLQIQRPELRIRKSGSGSEPDKFVHSDVPDLASVHGKSRSPGDRGQTCSIR